MRYITQHSQHVYKSKSSAMRAGCNAVGDVYLVEAPELHNRFDGCITITATMVSVETYGGGWRWSYTFDIADVIVSVRNSDGTVGEARYADVAHWIDCNTPVSAKLHELAARAFMYTRAWYSAGTDELRMGLQNKHMPFIIRRSGELGINLTDLFSVCRAVEDAFMSTTPHYIAEVLAKAECFGFCNGHLQAHLAAITCERGCHYDKYLHDARRSLSRAA